MILSSEHEKLLIKFLYWYFANNAFSIDNIANPIELKYNFINFNFEKKKKKKNSFLKNNYKKYYR